MLLERIGADRFLLVDDRLLDWIAARIPQVGPDHGWGGKARAIGVVVAGEIVAGMACMDWDQRHGNIEIAMAADSARWASRDTIRRLLAWPFDQLGCRRLTTIIAADNDRALRLNEGLGFKREGLMRHGFGERDAVILGLLKEELPAWAVAPTRESETRS